MLSRGDLFRVVAEIMKIRLRKTGFAMFIFLSQVGKMLTVLKTVWFFGRHICGILHKP